MDRSDRSSMPRLAQGLGRREFLRGIAAAGAVAGAGGLLGGCGGSSAGSTQHLTGASRPDPPGRQPEARPHRRLEFGHRRPAQEPHLHRHRPAAVPLPATGPAEQPGRDRVRTGRVDHRASRLAGAVGDPAAAGRHLPRRQGLHRGRRHLHLPADLQQRLHREVRAGPDRPGPHQGPGQAHRAGAAHQAVLQLRGATGRLLVQPLHRPGGLQPGPAGRHRAVRLPELHSRPAQRVHPQPALLEIRAAPRGHPDHHRFQRQHHAPGCAVHRRHRRRGRAGRTADRLAGHHERDQDGGVALRGDHPVHHARRPAAVQRRQRPPGHAAADRPPAADRLGARRVRGGRQRPVLPVRPRLRPHAGTACPG